MENNQQIIIIVQSIITAIPTLFLIWKNYERKKPKRAIRSIRLKKELAKVELEEEEQIERIKMTSRLKKEKIKLELKSLEEEANYLNRMSKWESGTLNKAAEVEQTSELNNLTTNLKTKGEESVQKATESLNSLKDKGGETIQKAQSTFTDLKDKGAGAVKGVTDQLKGLKDKFFGSKK